MQAADLTISRACWLSLAAGDRDPAGVGPTRADSLPFLETRWSFLSSEQDFVIDWRTASTHAG